MLPFILYALLGIILIILTIMVINFLRFGKKTNREFEKFQLDIDSSKVAEHLSDAIKIKTISNPDDDLVDWNEFRRFQSYLEVTFPNIHSTMKKEVIADYSLMYKWEGADKGKKPIALLSHMDVVPVMPGTEDDWDNPAFSGYIDDTYIWGRGTLDMKGYLIALCEAVEKLIGEGFEPQCDIYLCFGHNEEIVGAGGNGGAEAIANVMKDRGIELGMVIDEGGAIVPGTMFNIPKGNLAVIGTGEKGYLDVKITSNKQGGHSSQPPKDNGLVDLSKLLIELDKNPRKKRMIKPVRELFKSTGAHMSPVMKFMLSNLWITKPLVMFFLQNSSTTNALIRTTLTPTMAEGSPAGNILPQRANVNINSRILQGECINDVIEHIKKNANGMKFDIEILRGKEPSAISPTDNDEFQLVVDCIKTIYDDIPVAPYLMVGGTDSCFYEIVADNIYRVGPFVMTKESLGGIHGTNEKMPIDVLANGVRFYYLLVTRYCG